jgi:hypothetical protein
VRTLVLALGFSFSLLVSVPAKAESIAKLFSSSQLWEDKKALNAKPPKKRAPASPAKRDIATEPVVQTYVYSDTYSFQSNRAEVSPDRDLASVPMKGRVIGVRRELALTEAASKGINQEFLINAGSRLGISEGSKLKVYRTLPVVDPYNGNKQHELKVDFATLKVIHVEDDVSVAQLEKLGDAKKGPYVGLRGILVGDYVSAR